MDLEQAFLADMVANPNDATPWLVFADWLDERDDPRGELVRLLRLCWDEPQHRDFETRHARLQELFKVGVQLPLPRFTNWLGMEFVWVPPGRGQAPFWLGIHLVTQGQWRAVMGENPSHFARTGSGAEAVADIPDLDLAWFPVESVSWEDAQEFLTQINSAEPDDPWCYDLPSAEQWVHAVCSPVTCPADRAARFYFAEPTDSLSSLQANFLGNQPTNAANGPTLNRTSRVGSYRPNRIGLHDHHGNVWEWTSTPGGRSSYVRHGGSWCGSAEGCSVKFRLSERATDREYYLGLRVARLFHG